LHTPMYNMHKYWARKTHNVVAEYIKVYSIEGDTVLDPFCGSGTTGVVALKNGRRFIGIDLNEDYCELAKVKIIKDSFRGDKDE